MIINMTTFAGRQKHYIDQTPESLSQSDGRDLPLNLILGSYDTSHVEKYRGAANIVIAQMGSGGGVASAGRQPSP
jgi:hypothetical protein